MTHEELIDALAHHALAGRAPREELAWLAAHGEVRTYNTNDLVVGHIEPVDGMYVVLSGSFTMHVNRGGGWRKLMKVHAGEIVGVVPYSRLQAAPGDSIAEEPTTAYFLARADVPALIHACPTLTEALVHVMVDRTRMFTSNDLHDDKMKSLGKLAAGLAHELNNPASAAARNAAVLFEYLSHAETAAEELGAAHLAPPQRAVLATVRAACAEDKSRTAIDTADREDAFAAWLAAHALDTAPADTLARSCVTLGQLDALASALGGDALAAALRWIADDVAARALTRDIVTATARIRDLVDAMKDFTFMDRAPVPQEIDVARGLADTIAILRGKAETKRITVALDIPATLPRVNGFGGELNQIWQQVIDNAIDAAPDGGEVSVRASHDLAWVVVRVIDNGAGIPDALREKIFEPFFTTKPVGQGTGLGLDIVQRIVRWHDGEIAVDSRPGNTEFQIHLPVAPTSHAA